MGNISFKGKFNITTPFILPIKFIETGNLSLLFKFNYNSIYDSLLMDNVLLAIKSNDTINGYIIIEELLGRKVESSVILDFKTFFGIKSAKSPIEIFNSITAIKDIKETFNNKLMSALKSEKSFDLEYLISGEKTDKDVVMQQLILMDRSTNYYADLQNKYKIAEKMAKDAYFDKFDVLSDKYSKDSVIDFSNYKGDRSQVNTEGQVDWLDYKGERIANLIGDIVSDQYLGNRLFNGAGVVVIDNKVAERITNLVALINSLFILGLKGHESLIMNDVLLGSWVGLNSDLPVREASILKRDLINLNDNVDDSVLAKRITEYFSNLSDDIFLGERDKFKGGNFGEDFLSFKDRIMKLAERYKDLSSLFLNESINAIRKNENYGDFINILYSMQRDIEKHGTSDNFQNILAKVNRYKEAILEIDYKVADRLMERMGLIEEGEKLAEKGLKPAELLEDLFGEKGLKDALVFNDEVLSDKSAKDLVIMDLLRLALKSYKNALNFYKEENPGTLTDNSTLQLFPNLEKVSPKAGWNKRWDVDYDNFETPNKMIYTTLNDYPNGINKVVDPVTGDILVKPYTILPDGRIKVPPIEDPIPFGNDKGNDSGVSVDGFFILRDMIVFLITLWQYYYDKFVGMDARQSLQYILREIYNWMNTYVSGREDYWQVFRLMSSYAEGIVDRYCPTYVVRHFKDYVDDFSKGQFTGTYIQNFSIEPDDNGNLVMRSGHLQQGDKAILEYTFNVGDIPGEDIATITVPFYMKNPPEIIPAHFELVYESNDIVSLFPTAQRREIVLSDYGIDSDFTAYTLIGGEKVAGKLIIDTDAGGRSGTIGGTEIYSVSPEEISNNAYEYSPISDHPAKIKFTYYIAPGSTISDTTYSDVLQPIPNSNATGDFVYNNTNGSLTSGNMSNGDVKEVDYNLTFDNIGTLSIPIEINSVDSNTNQLNTITKTGDTSWADWSDPYVESSNSSTTWQWISVSDDADWDKYGQNLNKLKDSVWIPANSELHTGIYISFKYKTKLTYIQYNNAQGYYYSSEEEHEAGEIYEYVPGWSPSWTGCYAYNKNLMVYVPVTTSGETRVYDGAKQCIGFTLEYPGRAFFEVHSEGASGTLSNYAYYYVDGIPMESGEDYPPVPHQGNIADAIFETPLLQPGQHTFCYQVVTSGNRDDGMKMRCRFNVINEYVSESSTATPASYVDVYVDGQLVSSYTDSGNKTFSYTFSPGNHSVRIVATGKSSSTDGVIIGTVVYTSKISSDSGTNGLSLYAVESNSIYEKLPFTPAGVGQEYTTDWIDIPQNTTIRWEFDNSNSYISNVQVMVDKGEEKIIYPEFGISSYLTYNYSGAYNTIQLGRSDIHLGKDDTQFYISPGILESIEYTGNCYYYPKLADYYNIVYVALVKWIPETQKIYDMTATLRFYLDDLYYGSYQATDGVFTAQLPSGQHTLRIVYDKVVPPYNPMEYVEIPYVKITNAKFDHAIYSDTCQINSGNPAVEELIKKLIDFYKNTYGDIYLPDVKTNTVILKKYADRQKIHAGETVTYTYTIKNDTDKQIHVDILTDDKLGDIAKDFVIDAGQSKTFKKSSQIFSDTLNTATCKYSDGIGNYSLTAQAFVKVVVNNLIVEKFVDKSEVAYGESVTYTFKVRNAGNEVLTNVTVDDDKLGHIDTLDYLNPGEERVYEKQVPIYKDTHNIVTAVGYDSLGQQVQDTAEADVVVKLSKLIKELVWILT